MRSSGPSSPNAPSASPVVEEPDRSRLSYATRNHLGRQAFRATRELSLVAIIEPALAAEIRDLPLRVDAASAWAAEAVRMAEEAEARARAAEAVALRLVERLHAG